MKKTLTFFFILTASAVILLSSPEFSIAKIFIDKIEKEYGTLPSGVLLLWCR